MFDTTAREGWLEVGQREGNGYGGRQGGRI